MQRHPRDQHKCFPMCSSLLHSNVSSDLMIFFSVELEQTRTLERDSFMLVACKETQRKAPKLQNYFLSLHCVCLSIECVICVYGCS